VVIRIYTDDDRLVVRNERAIRTYTYHSPRTRKQCAAIVVVRADFPVGNNLLFRAIRRSNVGFEDQTRYSSTGDSRRARLSIRAQVGVRGARHPLPRPVHPTGHRSRGGGVHLHDRRAESPEPRLVRRGDRDPAPGGWIIFALLRSGLEWIGSPFRSVYARRSRVLQLGQIVENSPSEIYAFDIETLRFVHVNEGARKNLGYTMRELESLTPVALKPAFTTKDFAALLAPLLRGERTKVHFETDHRRKDGTTYPVEAHLQLGTYDDRRVFVAIILDVTERRRAEEDRDRMAMAMEQTEAGITILDRHGRLEYANETFARIMDRPRDEIVGEMLTRLVEGDGDGEIIESIRKRVEQPATWTGRTESARKDGRVLNCLVSVTPLRDLRGEINGFVGVIRDVTHQTRIEAELQQRQKMEAIGLLAGGIAHDFNNLLSVIGINADIVLGHTTGIGSEAAAEISRAVDRAAAITSQLLTFSRTDSGTAQVRNLNTRLAEMQSFLQRLVGDDVSLEFEPGMEDYFVRAKWVQIEQAIMNLAINGRDAMPDGGKICFATSAVELGGADRVDTIDELPAGSYVLLSVSDEGPGIEEARHQQIFEPFFTTKEKGTGLGLSVAYGAVRRCGGALRVSSVLNRGCTFRIYLPRMNAASPIPEPCPTVGDAIGAPDASVLLVEDEPELRRVLREVLESDGYRVTALADADEAVRLVADGAGPFDVLVTDVVMPRMSGIELAKWVRERTRDIRVVMISGYWERAQEVHSDLCDAFVAKPFRAEDLSRVVARILDENG